ncbi:aryl-sulfate sulfotransferase [Vibrio comitans]|uniref:aryl-sulfate sulfotransferase n=1 Tax=Vibrio comitans TaxID=413401 RepID=UPI00142EBBFC|nr:aryl-sulfate sulfotransferase [Vibrio comitans]
MSIKSGFVLILCGLFVGCNDSDNQVQSIADTVREQLKITEIDEASSVFISSLQVDIPTAQVSSIKFEVQPRQGSVTEPISVTYDLDSTDYSDLGLKLPIWGMYENALNTIDVEISFTDNSFLSESLQVQTGEYIDTNNIFNKILVNQELNREDVTYSYFYLENRTDQGPVIMDIEGNIRWVGNTELYKDPDPNYLTALFDSDRFVIHSGESLVTLFLDGRVKETDIVAENLEAISPHHEITWGKEGYLLNINATKNSVYIIEAILIEVDENGVLINEWDFGEIISNFMLENGDDPSSFVRDGIDWFHMNSAIYDPSDNSIIASSRENFVIKVDYDTKEIIWILGDETKYWATFPSLLALSLFSSDIKPMGEHALSLVDDTLMLFNNGQASFNQPDSAPVGDKLSSSLGMKWVIDESTMSADVVWQYDGGIYSDICSSIYEQDGAYLVTYSAVDRTNADLSRAIIRGVSDDKSTLFEYEHSNNGSACVTWNSDIIETLGLTL